MFKFKKTQKFRVIISGISLFTTAWTIRMGIGDFTSVNGAVQYALKALEHCRDDKGVAGEATVGLCGDWAGFAVQINTME